MTCEMKREMDIFWFVYSVFGFACSARSLWCFMKSGTLSRLTLTFLTLTILLWTAQETQ